MKNTNFESFLSENNLVVVLVNHYKVATYYSWHYKLESEEVLEFSQNERIASLSEEEVELGVENLLIENRRFEIWHEDHDQTLHITTFD